MSNSNYINQSYYNNGPAYKNKLNYNSNSDYHIKGNNLKFYSSVLKI